MRVQLIGLAIATTVFATGVAFAQGSPASPTKPGQLFAGAAFTSWSSEDGLRGWRPYPGGTATSTSLASPVLAWSLSAGVFVTTRWQISGELSARRARSASITETVQTPFESWELSSQYTSRERLGSVAIGRSVGGRSAWAAQILGAFTISRRSQSLTGRTGWYRYPGGETTTDRPDLLTEVTRFGVSGGADVLRTIGHGLAAGAVVRVHLINPGPRPVAPGAIPPGSGSRVILIGGGVRWGAR